MELGPEGHLVGECWVSTCRLFSFPTNHPLGSGADVEQ